MYAQVVLFAGFDPLDVIAPFEVLSAGSDAVGGELIVELVAAEGPGELFMTAITGTWDVKLEDTAGGEHVTWRQSVTKPMRLNLVFDVTVVGDTLSGHSRAGNLPRTQVNGRRYCLRPRPRRRRRTSCTREPAGVGVRWPRRRAHAGTAPPDPGSHQPQPAYPNVPCQFSAGTRRCSANQSTVARSASSWAVRVRKS